MIGKVPRAGRGFRGLVSYLLRGDRNIDQDRVAWSVTRNLLNDNPEQAAKLMQATAAKSRRVKTPVYHYVISWHHNEAPSDDVMQAVADTTSADLGLEDHQLLYIAHHDTQHRHVHIVANRVHPETGIAWKNSHDYRTIELSLRRQAEAYGFDQVPGRHSEPSRYRSEPRRPRDRDLQRARRPVEDLPTARWSKEYLAKRRAELADVLSNATSWDELDDTLAKSGYALVRKGQGLVIANAQGTAKLSDLGKQLRLGELQERMGKSFDDHLSSRRQPDPAELAIVRENYAALKLAQEGVAFSFLLYRWGLVSRAQLDRYVRDKDQAADAVRRTEPITDQISRTVGDALKSEPTKKQPQVHAGQARRPRRDRGR